MSGLEPAVVAAQIGIPLVIKNRNSIGDFIRRKIFKLKNIEFNIYASQTIRFKSTQEMEFIYECMINSISKYKIDDKECSYKIDNVEFTIIPEFTFNTGIEIENSDYDFYPKNDNLFIPGINALTIYFFAKKPLPEYLTRINELITLIGSAIMKDYPVKQTFSFLYLQFDTSKDKLFFQNQLQNKSKNIDTTHYFLNSKNDEIKLSFTSPVYSLIANIL